jgi:uncharacterized membrane protein
MLAIIGIIIVGLLFFFVLLPMVINLIGNLIGFLVGAAIIVGVIALCIAYPPIILVIVGLMIYEKFKENSTRKEFEEIE